MKIKLTSELEQKILASIRAGGYPHVAAAAWGVSPSIWRQWRRRGAGKGAGKLYREFFHRVEEAHGQARLRAELAALDDDPRFWLKHGPGKERPGRPGWTVLAKPAPPRRRSADFFSSPDALGFLANLRGALAPFPDALAAFTRSIVESKNSSRGAR